MQFDGWLVFRMWVYGIKMQSWLNESNELFNLIWRHATLSEHMSVSTSDQRLFKKCWHSTKICFSTTYLCIMILILLTKSSSLFVYAYLLLMLRCVHLWYIYIYIYAIQYNAFSCYDYKKRISVEFSRPLYAYRARSNISLFFCGSVLKKPWENTFNPVNRRSLNFPTLTALDERANWWLHGNTYCHGILW